MGSHKYVSILGINIIKLKKCFEKKDIAMRSW